MDALAIALSFSFLIMAALSSLIHLATKYFKGVNK
tara:strand:+ start:1358 stop:1462 length:105 start_codon:yes stop_codon:yes gene_type:complete